MDVFVLELVFMVAVVGVVSSSLLLLLLLLLLLHEVGCIERWILQSFSHLLLFLLLQLLVVGI